MKISPSQLQQLIQEVIDEESLTEGIQDKRFEEFEDDVMEIGSDGGGQVEIKDLITRLSDKYNSDEIQNMISILVDAGTLTQLGDSEFFSIPDDRKIYQDDEDPAYASQFGSHLDGDEYDEFVKNEPEWVDTGEDTYDYDEEEFLSTASPEEVIARYSKNIEEGVFDALKDLYKKDKENRQKMAARGKLGGMLSQIKKQQAAEKDAKVKDEKSWEHPVKETENKWDPLTIVMKHRGKLDVTAGMSDEEIMLVNTHCPKTIEDYASQITTHPAIKDEYTALGDWQYQENIERMIKEELAKLLK